MFTDQDASTIDEQTLQGIIEFVWSTLLAEELSAREPAPIDDAVYAAISIGGQWTATLEVRVSQQLARRFAAQLLDLDAAELLEEDVDDALGELANVVGGNVKGLLDDGGAATLSLPIVSRTQPTVAGGQLTATCAFDATGEPMIWQLFERP